MTYTSIIALFERKASLKSSGDMSPLLSVFRTANQESLVALGVECFQPDVLASVTAECSRLIEAEKTSLHGASLAGSIQAAIGVGPAEFQIQSTFLNFNDSGLVEHALGEAHLMRLSLQEVGDTMTKLPIALEYRARRSLLWAGHWFSTHL